MKQDKGFKGVLPSIDHSKYPLSTKQEKTPHGHHQMVNTEIKLLIFFATKEYVPPVQCHEPLSIVLQGLSIRSNPLNLFVTSTLGHT